MGGWFAEFIHLRRVLETGSHKLDVDLLLVVFQVGLLIKDKALVLDRAQEDLVRLTTLVWHHEEKVRQVRGLGPFDEGRADCMKGNGVLHLEPFHVYLRKLVIEIFLLRHFNVLEHVVDLTEDGEVGLIPHDVAPDYPKDVKEVLELHALGLPICRFIQKRHLPQICVDFKEIEGNFGCLMGLLLWKYWV